MPLLFGAVVLTAAGGRIGLGLVDGGARANLGLAQRHMAHLRLLFWFMNVHCGHCHVADSNVLLPDSWEDELICDIRSEGASFKAGVASFPSMCAAAS